MKRVGRLFLVIAMVMFCVEGLSQRHEKRLAKAISKMSDNNYSFTSSAGWGAKSKRWEAQEAIKSIATDDDLDSLARYCTIPAVRALAFRTLAQKQSDICYEIAISSLKDTSIFCVFSFDMGRIIDVASFYLDVINGRYDEGLSVFSDKQMITLDSIVVFTPGLKHIWMVPYASRVSLLQDIHNRVKELFYEGHYELFPLLASYKHPEDKSLIISALREQLWFKGSKLLALSAIKVWPDKDFIPELERIRDEELARKGFSYGEPLALFEAIMAYDNDWAYNFIDDMFTNEMFLNLKEFQKSAFSECLYRSFKKEEKPRFKPLIYKFGKKPYSLDD